MIETCIIKIACVYGITVAVSFITIISLCLVILFNKRIQKTATDRFGIDEFFKSGHSTQKSWFLILLIESLYKESSSILLFDHLL